MYNQIVRYLFFLNILVLYQYVIYEMQFIYMFELIYFIAFIKMYSYFR